MYKSLTFSYDFYKPAFLKDHNCPHVVTFRHKGTVQVNLSVKRKKKKGTRGSPYSDSHSEEQKVIIYGYRYFLHFVLSSKDG